MTATNQNATPNVTPQLVLITGAAGGLGRAVMQTVQRTGATVAMVSRDSARLAEFTDAAICIEADVSTPEGAALVFTRLKEAGLHADALVHCAGQAFIAPLHRTTVEQYRACLAANLDSAFFTLQGFIDAARAAQKPGAVVFMTVEVQSPGLVTGHNPHLLMLGEPAGGSRLRTRSGPACRRP